MLTRYRVYINENLESTGPDLDKVLGFAIRHFLGPGILRVKEYQCDDGHFEDWASWASYDVAEIQRMGDGTVSVKIID